MDLKPIMRYIIRVLYPGTLLIILWSARDVKSLPEELAWTISANQLVAYGAVALVAGTIIYTLCRAVFFECLLNRFLRDRLIFVSTALKPEKEDWTNWFCGGPTVAEKEEKKAILKAYKDGLSDFLAVRLGWINAQLQTVVLLLGSLAFSNSDCVLRKAPWVLFVVCYSVLVSIVSVKQCRTVWLVEKG